MTLDLASALAPSGRFVKWETPGTTYAGTITSVEMRQATRFGTTEPDCWDDGSPKHQALIRLDTQLRDDADDDGARVVVVNLWSGQKRALVAACKAAGIKEPAAGMGFIAKHASGIGTAASPRVFEYAFTPAESPLAGALDVEPPAAADDGDVVEKVKALLAAGLDESAVATAVGLPATTVAALALL